MKDIIWYVKRLIQTPSLSGEEKDLALFIRDSLNEFSLDEVYIDELGDVIGFVRGRSLHPLIILEGHMDHVPPGNLKLWKHEPFSAKVINGKIFGRGAADMKASLAAMMFASKGIASKEYEGTLALCFVVHEETVEGTAIGHIIEEKIGDTPDLVILGEATSLELGIGHRGRALIKAQLWGKTAHASMPELGLNALHAASKLINYVEELNPNLPFHQKLGKATITTIGLEATPKNVPQIPDKCELIFDRRMILQETEDDILEPIKNKASELVEQGEALDATAGILEEEIECWTGKKLKVKDFFPSWLIKETDIVQKALKSLSDGGFAVKTHIWRFSTDGVYTYGSKGIPTIGIGPGNETLAHQPNECVSIKEVEKAVQAYAAIVKSFISRNSDN